MTMPHYPLRVFYDGACPVCSREIAHYLRRDHQGKLLAVDISAADFDPQSYRIPLPSFLAELHAIDQAGTVYRGVAAFRAIWLAFPDVPHYRWLAVLLQLPLINPCARLGYRLFARFRAHLPGRRDACAVGTCRIGRSGRPPSQGDSR